MLNFMRCGVLQNKEPVYSFVQCTKKINNKILHKKDNQTLKGVQIVAPIPIKIPHNPNPFLISHFNIIESFYNYDDFLSSSLLL